MHAAGVKMHLESLASGAVQAIKRRSLAPRGLGWPINSEPNAPIMFKVSEVDSLPSKQNIFRTRSNGTNILFPNNG
jgi:hypothetical protein